MSTWATPITWVNGAVTAASMNTIRDNLTFLKGALDLMTGSTTADSGTGMGIDLTTTVSTSAAYQNKISGDTSTRFAIRGDGRLLWGDGAGSTDVELYRSAANTLCTNDAVAVKNASGIITYGTGNTILRNFLVDGDSQYNFRISSDGALTWGIGGSTAVDTDLYRGNAGELKTSDRFYAVDGITTRVVAGAVTDGSFGSTPPSGTIAIDVTNSKIYVRVGTTWKSVTVA